MSDLTRYLRAQERTHAAALRELQAGYKASHWSWWEIPQIIGLGMTSTSREYAIKDLAEAKEYLQNDTLREHLTELCDALLSLDTNDAERVMGSIIVEEQNNSTTDEVTRKWTCRQEIEKAAAAVHGVLTRRLRWQ